MRTMITQKESDLPISHLKLSRKQNQTGVMVTQKLSDFDGHNKNAPYRHWIRKLDRKDTLPRGKFFKGKVGGRTKFLVIDEMHQLFNKNSTEE